MKDDFQPPSRDSYTSEVSCAHVRQWLREWRHSDTLTLPLPDLCAHVAQCHLCQGSLLALVAEVAQVPTSALTADGQTCGEDLAAFIDQELADARVALRLYPHVWWHLWICEECAETYRLTRVLVEAEHSGRLAPVPFPVPVDSFRRVPQAVLYLPRRRIASTMSTLASLGVMRGSDGESFVVTTETDSAGREISLSFQQQATGAWRIVVEIVPPPNGQLVLTIGEESFQARFDSQGVATITDVPTPLLSMTHGPDLVAGIMFDE